MLFWLCVLFRRLCDARTLESTAALIGHSGGVTQARARVFVLAAVYFHRSRWRCYLFSPLSPLFWAFVILFPHANNQTLVPA